MVGWLKGFFQKLRRACVYAWFGWNNPDCDFAYLYSHIHFKLDRMAKELESFAKRCGTKDGRPHKSARLAARLSKRLSEDKYEAHFTSRHDKKWGAMEHKFIELPNGNYAMSTFRPSTVTKKQKEQEKKEYLLAMEGAALMRDRDLLLLYEVLSKYDRRWWT